MGKAIVKDLLNSEDVKNVLLVDTDVAKAREFVEATGDSKLQVVDIPFDDDTSIKETLQQGDVAINALFYIHNQRIAKLAIDAGVSLIDLGGPAKDATQAVLALNDEAKAKGVTIIPDLGVAPGLTNILAGYGAKNLDSVEEIKLYAGDIPVTPVPPVDYIEVFSIGRMFDLYSAPSKAIIKGEATELAPLSGKEAVYFDDMGVLEAFYSAGGIGTLVDSYPDVDTLTYKTVRYKGHADKMSTLVELGLFDDDNYVEVNGKKVNVRKVVRKALHEKLKPEAVNDVLLIRVLAKGKLNDRRVTNEYELAVEGSPEKGTAMAKVVSATVSVVAKMIADKTISDAGVYAPESIVPGDAYIKAMAGKGVHIKETVHRSAMIVMQ